MRVHVQAYIIIRIKCIIFPQISASSVFQIETSFAIKIFLVKDKLKTSSVWYHYNYKANVHLNSFPQPPILTCLFTLWKAQIGLLE